MPIAEINDPPILALFRKRRVRNPSREAIVPPLIPTQPPQLLPRAAGATRPAEFVKISRKSTRPSPDQQHTTQGTYDKQVEAVTEFFQTMISPGMLPFTALLGVLIAYWSIVAVGMLDLDFLDGALDGAFEGLADGAIEGAADGLIEGAADGIADGALQAAGSHPGPVAVFFSFINLGRVPATIIISFVIVKMWLIAMCYYTFMPDFLLQFMPEPVSWLLVIALSLIPSLYLTGLTTRPLRKVFKLSTVTTATSLIGKMCRITSSKVTDRFGTAEVASEGAPFLLNVVCENANELNRDSEAVIVDYDKKTGTYYVRPISK